MGLFINSSMKKVVILIICILITSCAAKNNTTYIKNCSVSNMLLHNDGGNIRISFYDNGCKYIYRQIDKKTYKITLENGNFSTFTPNAEPAVKKDVPVIKRNSNEVIIYFAENGVLSQKNDNVFLYNQSQSLQNIPSKEASYIKNIECMEKEVVIESDGALKTKTGILYNGQKYLDIFDVSLKKDYTHPIFKWIGNDKLILLTAHRRENLGENMYNMFKAIKRVVDENNGIKVIYPVHLNPQVRKIANDNNIHVANKPDSEDICFIPDGNYKKFLEENSNLKPKKGNIINTKGEILGVHQGLYNYTIGQRKGLGISNKVPLFVLGFNKEKNEVIVGEESELYKKEIYVKDINLLLVDKIDKDMKVTVKTRYSTKSANAKISESQNIIKIIFDEPQRAITPGQSAVFYLDDIVVGGGKILK